MAAVKSQKKKKNQTGKDKITRLKRTGKNNTQEMARATIVFIHIRNSTRTLTEKMRNKEAILSEVQ